MMAVAASAPVAAWRGGAALRCPQSSRRALQQAQMAAGRKSFACRTLQFCHALRPHRRAPCAPRASSGEAAAAAEGGIPAGWDLANRVSGDAMAMLAAGELIPAEIILKKGIAELQEQHPGDPSTALLHTQLWNLLSEAAQYEGALEQAQAAYDLMLSYFGPDSADAAFHGIRLGISLILGGGDLDRAQELLIYGGTAAQHNLEIFWNKCQELEAAGQDPGELMLHTRKLMVSLAECNFYGAIGIARLALQNADEVPMTDLEEAWLGGVKQMAMALPPEHPMFETALRELGRLVPDASGRPEVQAELEGVVTRARELLYLIKQMPESMAPATAGSGEQAEGGAEGAEGEEEFLP